MKYLFSFLFLVGILCAPPSSVLAQALDQDAQSITTGNNTFDAGTSLGVTTPTHILIENTGSVVVHVAWTQAAATAVDPALILNAYQSAELTCDAGFCPTSIWAKGVGAAGTIKVTTTNRRAKVVQQIVDAEALADSTRIRKRSFTVGFADFGDADTSETETDGAGALPSGAVLVSYRKVVTTGIGGASLSAVVSDCGFNGATDVLEDGQDSFTGATSPQYGAGANAKPNAARAIGGLTPQCTFVSTDDDIGDATAGSVTIEIYYSVPGPG